MSSSQDLLWILTLTQNRKIITKLDVTSGLEVMSLELIINLY